MIKCFMITPNGRARVSLRRYTQAHTGSTWTCEGGWHEAMVLFAKCNSWRQAREGGDWVYAEDRPAVADDNPRWPRTCEKCDYAFVDGDIRQVFVDRVYVGPDGAKYSLRKLPPGALWWAEWLEDLDGWWKGPDGRVLMAKTPGGEWCIDSRASNCTMPDDDEHRCWIRHGTPPEIHVDKNGKTCQAGAGSIISGNYHGFLHNGYFT